MATKRKTKKKTTKRQKKTSANYTINIIGLFIVIISIFAGFKLGLVGRFWANIYRIAVGDCFQILAIILVILGIVMFGLGKVPHLGFKRSFGVLLLLTSILAMMQAVLFQKLALNNDILGVSWRLIVNDMQNNQVATDVGGGMLGALLFSISRPLFSTIGTFLICTLLAFMGGLMFFDVKFAQVVQIGQQAVSWLQHAYKYFKTAYAKHQKQVKATAKSKAKKSPTPVHDFAEPTIPEMPLEQTEDDFEIEGPQPVQSQPNKTAAVDAKVETKPVIRQQDNSDYQLPNVDLLTKIPETDQSSEYELIDTNRKKLKQTLDSFGVQVEVKKATLGPTVTKYEVQPAVGVKVSKIVNLADDLALALAAKDIRIEAPIPGKPYVGIEVPNQHPSVVSFREIVEHEPQHEGHILAVPLGKDVYGQIAMCDLTKLPHLLIAGSTGSGKSVAINTIITGILMQARPSEVKLILIDPKMVELSVYNGIPHLLIPVVTEAKRATGALQKAVNEMERRYKLFEKTGNRKIEEYNQAAEVNNSDKNNPVMEKLPYIVIIVDELSDLMMAAGHEVEVSIVRLAQKARAAGMHLIIATQRPSVDVITGLIKANVPSRMAFAVSSNVDSRTILDSPGAEKLLGRGDMLFEPIGQSKPQRIQGAYISSEDVERVVKFVSDQQAAEYDEEMIPADPDSKEAKSDEPDDEYWQPAIDLVAHEQKASVSMLQRRFQIGYNRAARLVDYMEERGIVGPARGAKPRKVLIKQPGEEEQTDE
ncbi:MAG: hypothetical protein J6573_05675 [Lactobacillus sp.]|nr:hypothetical protein [Lactobacillus sp.]